MADKIGNDAWNIAVTQWDRDAYADYAFLGSRHESVMHVREAIERGDHDDMPMLKVVAFARTRLEQEASATPAES